MPCEGMQLAEGGCRALLVQGFAPLGSFLSKTPSLGKSKKKIKLSLQCLKQKCRNP